MFVDIDEEEVRDFLTSTTEEGKDPKEEAKVSRLKPDAPPQIVEWYNKYLAPGTSIRN